MANGAQRELEQHDAALTELSRRLQKGVTWNEPAALHWAALLEDVFSKSLLRKDGEDKLRALYDLVYNLPRGARLPACPEALRCRAGTASAADDPGATGSPSPGEGQGASSSAAGTCGGAAGAAAAGSGAPASRAAAREAARRVAEHVGRLHITLAEALAQIDTQRRPSAFFLLTCHLKKERPRSRACERFPWVSLGAVLLVLGLLVQCLASRKTAMFSTAMYSSPEAPNQVPDWTAVLLYCSAVLTWATRPPAPPVLLLALGCLAACFLLARHPSSSNTRSVSSVGKPALLRDAGLPMCKLFALASLVASLPRCCAAGIPQGVQCRARQFCRALGFGLPA